MTSDARAGDCKLPWEQRLSEHREVWAQKESLRLVYGRWHKSIKAACVDGPTLEVGGGGGHFKETWPRIISSDIVYSPWLDVQLDCMHLPLASGCLANVVGVDVLHHLADIDQALGEIARVLRPGGRLVFVEPYISPFSHLVRRLFHEEEIDLSDEALYSEQKLPEQANDAMPTLVFWRGKERLGERFPMFDFMRLRLSDPLVYPLTGGFGHKSILPQGILKALAKIEPVLTPLHRLMAFKMLVVAQKIE